MQFRERQVDGVTVIDVEGDFTMTAAPCPLQDFVKAVLRRGERRIVLNLAHIDRMDSTCLGELIESYRTTAAHGATLKIAQPDPHLLRQLQVTHFDTILETFATEAEAVTSFNVAESHVPSSAQPQVPGAAGRD
jgi:anti-sigma B factor antagonist